MRKLGLCIGALAVAGACLLGAACDPAQIAALQAKEVTVVGDSITWLSEPAIRAQLDAAVRPPWIDCYPGITTAQGLQILQQQNNMQSTLVIGLGTNDTDTTVFAASIDAFMAYVGPERKVYWINTYGPGPWQALNAVIDTKAQQYHFTVVDWASAIQAHPEDLSPDGLHPNSGGELLRAELIAEALAS